MILNNYSRNYLAFADLLAIQTDHSTHMQEYITALGFEQSPLYAVCIYTT